MELAESRLEQKEQEVSTTYIDLTRHGNMFGGKMKVEVGGLTHEFNDEELLTPRGRVASGNFGANYPEDVILVHPRGGVTIRHGQTGEDILEGSAKIGPARTKAGRAGEGRGGEEGRCRGSAGYLKKKLTDNP